MDHKESHLRSLLKTLSWRVVGTLTTGIIAYLVTGTVEAAALITGSEFFVKFIVFYLHERVWQKVP
ncbi:MAG: DUF2061 domain-containing protein [Pseudomonadales bacterium]